MSARDLVMAAAGVSTAAAPGQQLFTSSGTWVCPAGVTKVSVVAVGAGGKAGYFDGTVTRNTGGGGALAYTNNITVVPGNSYTITVGTTAGANSRFDSGGAGSPHAGGGGNGSTVGAAAAPGGTVLAGTGGAGGSGQTLSTSTSPGAGGAGGYSGAGGAGSPTNNESGSSGSGGGAGGGGGSRSGGGVGVLGAGANGAGGAAGVGGYGGSGGGDASGYTPGLYGGASAEDTLFGAGAVRIIWPGDLRQFPSTRTANE